MQLAFIKQQLNFEPYNIGGLSITFPLFPFLDKGKPQCLHTSDLKLTQLNRLCHPVPSRNLRGPPLLLYYWTCVKKQSAKDDGYAWTNDNCASHFPLLGFTANKPVPWNCHVSATTLRYVWHTAKIDNALTSLVLTLALTKEQMSTS